MDLPRFKFKHDLKFVSHSDSKHLSEPCLDFLDKFVHNFNSPNPFSYSNKRTMFRRQYMRYDSDVDGYESPIEVVTASGDGTDDAATPGATPVGVANQSVLILEKSGSPNTQSTADIEEASLPFDLAKKRTLGFFLWCRSKQQAKFALAAVFILFAFTAGLLIGGYLLFQSEALPFFSKADDPLPPLPPLPPKNVNVGVYYYPWHSGMSFIAFSK